jgi:rhodanese-related sulfurtransferase
MLKRMLAQAGNRRSAMSPIQHISAPELHEKLHSGDDVFLLDVRSPVEFQIDGHIQGAYLLPLPALRQRLSELPRDRTIVCVCRAGHRSLAACEELVAAGFKDVVNLSDGMYGWLASSLPSK